MSKRGELLRMCSDRKLSYDTLLKVSGIIKNTSASLKEEKAGQMLTMLNGSNNENDFILKLKTQMKN